jgi:carboxypeptidase Q
MKRLLIVCVCICIALTSNSQTIQDSIAIQQIANDVLTKGEAYNNLFYLCKKIGPRLSGSPQAQLAVEAGVSMLKKAGADTVYLQPCMVPHWVRGKKETGFITYNNGVQYPLQLCALGNSIGTGNKGVSAQIIEVHSFDELQQLGNTVKGKIVFFNVAMNPTHIHTFKAYGESGFARRSGAAIASKYGAVAVMVRSLASNDDDFPHTGVMSYNDSFPKIPAVAISTNNANWLSKQLLSKKTVTAFLQTNCSMQKEVLSYNVIGEIKGSEKADEIITVGGHLDSWDLAEGAHDDGAGIVQSIEVIRAFKAQGIQPKRTIRAVLFMNEENGGKGAAKYLAAAKEKNEQHLFALESDAGGFTPRGFSFDMPTDKITTIKLILPLWSVRFFGRRQWSRYWPIKNHWCSISRIKT